MTLQEQIAEIDVKINSLTQKMMPLQQKKSSLIRMKDKLIDELDKQNVEAIRNESKEKQAEYFINAVNGKVHTYDAFRKFLNEETALELNGFQSDVDQFQLRISMHQDRSNLEAVLNSIMFFLPMLKPNASGIVIFDIMEITLSADASYCLIHDKNTGLWEFTSSRRIRYKQSPITSNKDLKAVLSFICETAYYIPVEEEE